MSDPFGAWTSHSREFLLACNRNGIVTAADARAAELVGLREGDDLLARAAPGTVEKLEALLFRAVEAPVHDWEAPLVVQERGEVVTVSFAARPAPASADGHGAVQLLGILVPEHYARALTESQESLEEITHLHRQVSRQQRELEESHRGILALHTELQEKAQTLRRTADLRARMVAQVSHEFRTPLHTILGLSKLLLDHVDGPLAAEQEKQVGFIKSSAEELVSFVNDLLDLSRAEAGKAPLRVERQSVQELVAALRGMLRPLVGAQTHARLVFEEPPAQVMVETDTGMLAQIVRNLVSNALKFTPKGEVRVTAREDGQMLELRVKDTGIGIPAEELERIFDEYAQVAGPHQATLQGTGLGLPLSRKLAQLLGGTLEARSQPGEGATFVLRIPKVHRQVAELDALRAKPLDPRRAPVLVLEDDREALFGYERYLSLEGFQVLPARSVEEARELLSRVRPEVIVLDVMLEAEDTWGFLSELKANDATREIPVLVVTLYQAEGRARALGADGFCLKPVDKDDLLHRLGALVPSRAVASREGSGR